MLLLYCLVPKNLTNEFNIMMFKLLKTTNHPTKYLTEGGDLREGQVDIPRSV
jgi:hypothetical protein